MNLLTGLDVEELTQCGKITLIKTKNRDTEIDTRIMDIQVIGSGKDLNTNNIYCLCACSDGVVRALRYSFDQRKFLIISLLQGNGHGVMKLQIIGNHASTLVLGATSNGALLVWKWKPPALDQKLEYIKNPEVIPFSFSRRVRNAAVMSFKVVPSVSMSPDAENTFEYMMAMGSDDCSVSLWNLWVPVDVNQLSRIKLNEVWSEDQNQRGPIIGVEIFYDGKDWSLFTCSNDQVISRWNSTNGTLLGKAFAGVSDCQGFIINSNQDCITCFGDGITWIRSP
jgi:WD40 repeat protein